jgi:holin-like protein
MLAALTTLLVYQLVGEVIAQVFALPVPGPVIGLVLLFTTLVLRRGAGEDLRRTANGLLAHLSLLFVPAGVGVMVHFARLGEEWLPIAAAVVGSTVLTIAATAITMRWLLRRRSAS